MHEPSFSPSVSPEWREAGDKLPDTLRASHVELEPTPSPALAKKRRSRPLFTTAVIVTALVALASAIGIVTGKITPSGALAWLQPQHAAVTVSPTAENAATPAISPGVGTTATATSGDPSRLADSPTPATSRTAETVAVTVRVSPPNAVVSKDGRIVGTREVTLDVVSGIPTTLVVQLHGYVTNTVAIDGTQKSVDVILIPWKSTSSTATAAPAQKAVEAVPTPSGGQWDPSGI